MGRGVWSCFVDVVNPSTAAEMPLTNQEIDCVDALRLRYQDSASAQIKFLLLLVKVDYFRSALSTTLQRASHSYIITAPRAQPIAIFLGCYYHIAYLESPHLASHTPRPQHPLEPHLKLAKDIDYFTLAHNSH